MASSRKSRSKEKKNARLEKRKQTDSNDTHNGKKKRSKGCYGKKHKKSDNEYNNSVANDGNNFQASRTSNAEEMNQLSVNNKNKTFDQTDNFQRTVVVKEPNGESDRDINFNRVTVPPGKYQSYVDHSASRYSYEHRGTLPTTVDNGHALHTSGTTRKEEKIVERHVKKSGPKQIQSNSSTNQHEPFQLSRRASVISKVTSSFSSSSSYRRKKDKNMLNHMERHVQIEKTSNNVSNNNNNKNHETIVSIQRQVEKKHVPLLKTNKSYKITFAVTGLAQQQLMLNKKESDHGQQEVTSMRQEVRTVELHDTVDSKDIKRKRSSKRIQTDEAYVSSNPQGQAEEFSNLMKDVDNTEGKYLRSAEQERRQSDYARNVQGSSEAAYRVNGIFEQHGGTSSYGVGNGHSEMWYETKDSVDAGNRGGAMQQEWKRKGSAGIQNMNDDIGEAVYAAESFTYKEWMLIEHPDGKQEKREYRREMTADGDTNYIDLISGKILKTDKADWKKGEELMKRKKGTQMVPYEWRKDLGTNEWVKYNTNTNEELKRGDWKTGTEWYKNSKGKLVERRYVYKQTADGRWAKSDPRSGMIIDYSNCSALKGYKWVALKKGGRTKNKKWKKQDYEYIQDNKGKWLKCDPVTKKKLGKPSLIGWKEGVDYHMDKNGKVRKVKYEWVTENSGLMKKVNKKTKEPVNTVWMQGRETIMRDNNVTTNNFCWVKNGRNKWVKIDEDTGKALTNNIKSNKIATYNQSESTNKTFVSKTSKRIDNNKIVEENTRIEQNGGGVVKNTTTTIKY